MITPRLLRLVCLDTWNNYNLPRYKYYKLKIYSNSYVNTVLITQGLYRKINIKTFICTVYEMILKRLSEEQRRHIQRVWIAHTEDQIAECIESIITIISRTFMAMAYERRTCNVNRPRSDRCRLPSLPRRHSDNKRANNTSSAPLVATVWSCDCHVVSRELL